MFAVITLLVGNEDGKTGWTETAVFSVDTPIYDALLWAAKKKGVKVEDLKDMVALTVGQKL